MRIQILTLVLMGFFLVQAACVKQLTEGFLAGTDTVSIKTIPDNAKVYKDGTFVCNSPCYLPLKYSGTTGERYTVRLEKYGFKSKTFEMNRPRLTDKFWSGDYIAGSRFGAGNTFVFTYSLERQAEAIQASPQGTSSSSSGLQSNPSTTTLKQKSGKRVALVIGNSRYSTSPLPNPVNDARDITAILQSLGFEVMLVTDARLREMEEAIDRFSWKAQGATALFFYAGHGLQVDGENYLVPIGAEMDDEGDVRYETVSAGRVLDNLRYAKSNLNIIILDACRSNPFARTFRSSSRGLARLNAPRGSIIAFSTAPGDVASDGAGRNSPYATAFLRHAANPDLMVEAFFKEVAKDVSTQTSGKQRPWISSDFLGDFSFAR